MRPGPMGRGMPYKRKMCHLTVVVTDIKPGEFKTRNKNKNTNTNVVQQNKA
jgi:hypothetical protein